MMLSEHEFTITVRDGLYPKVRELEQECLNLFNRHYYPCGRGSTGFTGQNEVDWTIQLLRSSANFLTRLAKDNGIHIKEDKDVCNA